MVTNPTAAAIFRSLPFALLAFSFSARADTLFSSAFDGHTGVATTDYVQNVSGSATAGITDWTTDASVTSISALTVISPGGGFVNQGSAFSGADNIYVNHNLNIDDRANPRGYSLTFTTNVSWDLSSLSVLAGHSNNTGLQNQAFASDLTVTLSGGTLGAPVTQTKPQIDYFNIAYVDSEFDLTGTTLGAGTYTLEVTENNMGGGGAYAVFDGIALEGNPPLVDTDGDGLSDLYEQTIIDHNPSDGVISLKDVMGTGAAPAVTDFDNDGSSDAEELLIGTSPVDEDSDDDGFWDGAETNDGTFDSYDYVTHTGDTGTDPRNQDTDDDTLLDGIENNSGIFNGSNDPGTSPLLEDTDDDFLLDAWEVANGLNPNFDGAVGESSPGAFDGPDGDFGDPDEDTLDNFTEQLSGTHPRVADTDDDGLDDDVELFITLTNPLNPDGDGDGLKDGEEDLSGDGVLDPSETDPFVADTDGDSYSDGAEVLSGSDPRLATSVPDYSIFSSSFNGNTGAVVLAGDTDNTSGSTSLSVDWTQRSTVSSISGLSAIIDGDSGTLGGFAQLQGGTATYAGSDNVYLSRNHNLDTDRTTSKRGFSFTFTMDSSTDLGTLTVSSGHTTNTGNADQAYASDLVYVLSGGSLDSPVAGMIRENYSIAPAYHPVAIDLSGTTIGAGTYTLEVYQSNMTDGGAYAMFAAISLDDASALPDLLKVVSSGFNGVAFELEVSGLETSKSYLLKRSENLQDGFPTQIGVPITPTRGTAIFTDPAPTGTEGFYRVEEAP